MNLIDTHFHLDLFSKPTEVLRVLEEKKVYSIAVTNLPDVFDNCYNLLANSKYVRPALGYHPELSGTFDNKIEIFKHNIKKTRYIGEVGLDFSRQYDESNRKKQVYIFRQILDLCIEEKNKILTIHSRKSEKTVIDMVSNNFPGIIILHWYTGNIQEAKRGLDNGFYFSFNLSMIKSIKGQKLIKYIPKDRILTETDSPFTTNANDFNSFQKLEKLHHEIDFIFNKKEEKLKSREIVYENFKSILG